MKDINETLIQQFRDHVIIISKNQDFIHHKWFVKYHLEIVEKISLELCNIYSEADVKLVQILVWLHDYGKIIDIQNQYKLTLSKGKEKLLEIGFSNEIIEKVMMYVELIDKKENIENTPLEVKIVSSADGASHFVGPFFTLWWYENSVKSIDDLMKDNIRKSMMDWNNKIVLPEVKEAFKSRYEYLQEMNGKMPCNFIQK